MQERTRDRRSRRTFWIDDRIVDEFGPVMGQFAFGSAALAVYTVLARRADRDGDSWPRMRAIAEQAGVSQRTVQRAVRLLEMLGLVEVSACFEEGSHRQTSNLYTLLTPPDLPPTIDRNPEAWPNPVRRSLHVRNGHRAQSVADAREVSRFAHDVPPRQGVTPSPVSATPLRRPEGTPPHDREAGQEENSFEGNTGKEVVSQGENEAHEFGFTIDEVGLSSRQVWSTVLSEVARQGTMGRGDLEAWLRPAALVGREGDTLIVAAPNRVAQERIARRLMPALAAALEGTIGIALPMMVVVADEHVCVSRDADGGTRRR